MCAGPRLSRVGGGDRVGGGEGAARPTALRLRSYEQRQEMKTVKLCNDAK